eukprot:9494795-Pyramimonas_sp.AAC.1
MCGCEHLRSMHRLLWISSWGHEASEGCADMGRALPLAPEVEPLLWGPTKRVSSAPQLGGAATWALPLALSVELPLGP